MVLPPDQQLEIAGQAFCDLAEICQSRAECMWEDWRDRHNNEGPIPDDDFLDGLVQKTMFLDISDLIRKTAAGGRSRTEHNSDSESKAATVTKEEALTFALPDETHNDIITLEHSEDIPAWVTAIAAFLSDRSNAVCFTDLVRSIPLNQS